MQSSEITSFASPFDDFFQKYIPREHEKTLRNSFIQAIAIVTVGGIFFGLYYVYSILEPFCIPLFWALLSGIVLHPYKRTITKCFRSYLDRVVKNDQTIAVSLGITLVEMIDNTADAIGAYITNKWKVIVSVTVLLPVIHCITYFFPGALSELLSILQKFAFVDIISSLNSVQLHHVLVALVIFLLTLVVDKDEYRMVCQVSSCVTWIMSGAYLSNFLWPPLLYIASLLWVFGYCTEPAHDDEPDGSPASGQDTRIKSILMSFLGQVGLLGSVEVSDSPPKEDRRASDPAPTTSTPLVTHQAKETPIYEERDETECESNKITKALNLETANKVVTMSDTPKLMHPGISKLQKEHGILRSKEALRNMSVIDKASTTLGGNTPKTRVLGRSYVFRLKRRSSLHNLGTDSWTYIRYAFWSCVLLQLWVRPALAHLLPAPIAYYMVKQLSHYTGFTQFLVHKIISLKRLVWAWMEERFDIFFPPPLLFMLKVSYNAERKVLQGVKTYLDVIVTGLMILTMLLGFIVTTIFFSFQVYTESVYIVQSLTSITSSLNVSDSYIFAKINDSFSGSGYDSMENVMDGAYNYSRDWISQTLRHSLADADGNARRDLELKVLSLWDRSYQYWVTDQRSHSRPGEEALTSNLGELLTQLYSTSGVFNVSGIQTFVQNNMGTLTSISEQVWSLFKGNIGFLFDTSLGMGRIILHSGSGVVNFVFSIFIYLTALFYLLSNSTDSYIPMEVISQYSIFQISGVGSSIQKAINSVFLITIKMSVFYLLWTYITHVVFDASIVVLPILFSSFIAACPFTGQYIVALPAAMELYCLQHRPLGALLLVIFQVAPSWLVDTAIYSEVRGGIHPWFTGLAVVGGVYVFGVLGAIYGPLALCVLYVIINVYSTFITDSELDDTPEVTRANLTGRRSTLVRSGTVG